MIAPVTMSVLRMRRNVASGAALPVSPETQIPRVSSYARQPPAPPPRPPAATRRTGRRRQSRGWYLSLTPAVEKAVVVIKGTGVGARESGREALPFGSLSWRSQGDHNQDTKAELSHC